jgi:putative CocE/NonD family hydrolase
MSNQPRSPRRPADLIVTAMSRQLKLGPRRNKITVQRGVGVPMRDGTILQADHYAPAGAGSAPTVLMRCPYGRGWQMAMTARPYAERGYHVLLQSCRGTFGSGGAFTPARDEAADGQDTVAWLRQQPWFDGRLATAGPSYLAFTQWALALDPPPELFAMAVHISPHDLARAGFGQGPFELFNLLFWTDLMAHQEQHGAAAMMWRTMTSEKRLAPVMDRLPLAATGANLGGAPVPWYDDWLAHPDHGDPFWDTYSAAAALERVTVPTLLISGFHDFFVEQTMTQYQALRRREVPARLVVGPWTHMTIDMGLAVRETLAWLDQHSGGNGAARSRQSAAAVWTSGAGPEGAGEWRELAAWPPAAVTEQTWFLRAGGRLDTEPDDDASAVAGSGPAATTFRYDPADPTPSVGGRLMSLRSGGGQDNSALEARPDVVTFSSGPLTEPVEVAGVPVVRLQISSDNPRHDLFARLCDVGPDGKSVNLTDQIVRSDPGQVTPGEVREVVIPLTDVSHVFRAGHQIRLQLSGGAHPRFSRNLGTDDDLIHGTRTAPVTHQVQHAAPSGSALVLSLASPRDEPAGSGAADQETAGSMPAAI